jgi:hypothetical protein
VISSWFARSDAQTRMVEPLKNPPDDAGSGVFEEFRASTI